MRRKLYYLTAGLAATLLLAAACSSDDTAEKPVPEPATLTAPALTMEMAVRANASKTLAEKLIAPDAHLSKTFKNVSTN